MAAVGFLTESTSLFGYGKVTTLNNCFPCSARIRLFESRRIIGEQLAKDIVVVPL